MRMFVAAVLTLFICISTASAEDVLLKNLLAEETKVYEALKHKDHATLAKLLHEQYYAVLPEVGRLPLEKVLELQTTINSYKITDAVAIPVGQDSAILSYKFTWSGIRHGKEGENVTAFATSVWSKHDGGWHAVFYQETLPGD